MSQNHTVTITIRASNLSDSALREVVADLNRVGAAGARVSQQLDQVGLAATQTGGRFRSGALEIIGFGSAAGVAQAGTMALLGGLRSMAGGLWGLHTGLENTRARLLAFTKDGSETERLLAMIQEEAAKSPFAFGEMADAVAGLLPAAKVTGAALDELIDLAQILAASNPMEGLAGAAFALREALSGDFTSIIERFNLPRVYINQLKEEGVPALEIVSRALGQMGLDMDAVANLSLTAEGRLSTLMDTLRMGAQEVTAPLFALVSDGIEALIGATGSAEFEQNIDRWKQSVQGLADGVRQFVINDGPGLVSLAQTIATQVGNIATAGGHLLGIFSQIAQLGSGNNRGTLPTPTTPGGVVVEVEVEQGSYGILDLAKDIDKLNPVGIQNINRALDFTHDVLVAINSTANPAQIAAYADAWNLATSEFGIMNLELPPLSEHLKNVSGAAILAAAQQERNAEAAREHASALFDLDRSLMTFSSSIGRASQAWSYYRAEVNRSTTEFSLFEAAVAVKGALAERSLIQLANAQRDLTVAQDTLTGGMQVYAQQSAEYQGTLSALERAYQTLQKRQEEGIELSENEQDLLRDYPKLTERLKGGIDDAAISEGLFAAAKADVILAQDALNEAIARGENDLGPYEQALADARKRLDEFDPNGPARQSIDALTGAINNEDGLIAAIENLTRKIEYLSKPWLIAIDVAAEAAERELLRILELQRQINEGVYGLVPPDMVGPGPSGMQPMSAREISQGFGAQTTGGLTDISAPTLREQALAARDTVEVLDELMRYIEEAAQRLGEGDEAAREYVALAGDVVRVFQSGAELLRGLGSAPLAYTTEAAESVAAIKFMLEHAVQSLADSAAIMDAEAVGEARTFAEAAQATAQAMLDGLELLTALTEQVVVYGAAEERAIADLKFALEKAVASLADSAAIMDLDAVDAARRLAEAAGRIISALRDTLEFLQALQETGLRTTKSAEGVDATVRMLAAMTRRIADAFAVAAEGWEEEVSPELEAFADGVGAATAGLADTLDLLEALEEQGDATLEGQGQLREVADDLARTTRVVADAFAAAAAGWDAEVTPAVEAYADAAGAALDVLADTPEAIEAILEHGAAGEQLDIEALVEQFGRDIDIIVRAVEAGAQAWRARGAPAFEEYASGAGEAVALMADVAEAYAAIAETSRVSEQQMEVFYANFLDILELIAQMAAAAEPYAELAADLAATLEDIADAIGAAAGAVGDAAGESSQALQSTAGATGALAASIGRGPGGRGAFSGVPNAGSGAGSSAAPAIDALISSLLGFDATAQQLTDVIELVASQIEPGSDSSAADAASYAADQLGLLQEMLSNPAAWPATATQAVADQLAASLEDLGILGMSQLDFVNTLLGAVGVSPLAELPAAVGQAMTDAAQVQAEIIAEAVAAALKRATEQMSGEVSRSVGNAVRDALSGAL